jgi:hypothetical protein
MNVEYYNDQKHGYPYPLESKIDYITRFDKLNPQRSSFKNRLLSTSRWSYAIKKSSVNITMADGNDYIIPDDEYSLSTLGNGQIPDIAQGKWTYDEFCERKVLI